MGDKGIQELSGAQQQQFSYWEIGDPTHQEIHYEVLCFPRGLLLRATSHRYVDDTGIEPVTPTMSMWCSTAEPIVRVLMHSVFIKLLGKYSRAN